MNARPVIRPLARLAPFVAPVLALALAACGSVPATTFYTLVPPADATAAAATNASNPANAPNPSALSLSIGPVSVPESVDRPQFVVRAGPNEQRLLEQRRWSQSLPREIDAALLAHLNRLLPGARITVLGQSAAADARWRLSIDVQRFEAELGRQTVFEAIWTLRDRSDRVLDAGRFADRRPVAAPSYDALSASQAASIEGLAQTVADALRRQPAPAAEPAPRAASR